MLFFAKVIKKNSKIKTQRLKLKDQNSKIKTSDQKFKTGLSQPTPVIFKLNDRNYTFGSVGAKSW